MHVLVSVSSRHGGTRELGDAVAGALRDAGHQVDLTAPDDVALVHPYGAVVLGTAVYVSRAGLDLKDLVERQGAALRERPVWVFWSGVSGDADAGQVPDDVAAVAAGAGARAVRAFGGRVRREELSVAERSLVALVHPDRQDHRDLDGARAWGAQIAAALG